MAIDPALDRPYHPDHRQAIKTVGGYPLIRVTIQDANQTISFLTEQPTVMRLIAGCSINPNSLEELLTATDIYQRGLAATLMAYLMEFDKTLHRQGADSIHQEIAEARQTGQPFKRAFEVIDETTREASMQAGSGSLVIIDLNTHLIQTSSDLDIPSKAEVRVQIGETETNRLVSYILPAEWRIEHLA
jgi:hypothetical protein